MTDYTLMTNDTPCKPEDCHTEQTFDDMPSLMAWMWAYANREKPMYAIANIGDYRTWVSNETMIKQRPSKEWAQKAQDVRDTLRREELADEIFNCLNDKWDTLKLFGDIDDFTDIVLKQAREWCSDCYQDHRYC